MPPRGNTPGTSFEDYKEVLETVHLDFSEDDAMWVVSKLAGASGALVAKAVTMRNWLLFLIYVSEEFIVVVVNLDDWVANSSPPWVAHCSMVACRIITLDKHPGLIPVGIGDTLSRSIAKLVMRVAGDQANMTCGGLELYAGCEAGIDVATHAMVQRRW